MKNSSSRSCLCVVASFTLLGFLAVSCGKKSVPPATAEATPASETPPATAAAPASGQPAQDSVAIDARIDDARAAMKAKDYEKAISAVTLPPRAPIQMTGEQLMSLNSTKAEVINQLAAAAAAGDARAKAAYENVQRYYREHP